MKSVFSLPSVQAMQEKEAKAEAIQVRRVPLPQVLREVGVLEGRMFWTPIKERKGKGRYIWIFTLLLKLQSLRQSISSFLA